MHSAEALPAHLPYLRRFARALTGSQEVGDRFALAALEAAVANPVRMSEVPDAGVWLYRLLLKIWAASANPRGAASIETAEDSSVEAANRNLEAMTPLPRAAFLLHWVEGFSVERVGEHEFAVFGKVAERAVALNDVTTDEAADYVQGRLRRLGVDRALARAGARDGDTVHIADLTFTWYRDQPEFTGQPASRRRNR